MADVFATHVAVNKKDEKLHAEAGRYGEALGEMHDVPGAKEEHAQVDGDSENLRLAAKAVPQAQAEYEAAAEEERTSKPMLKSIVAGLIAVVRYIAPALFPKMPNLDTYEENDIYFACDHAAEILKEEPKTVLLAEGIEAAKADRLKKVKAKAEKDAARKKAKTDYKAARAQLQKTIKGALVFITKNAPEGSIATEKIKRKTNPAKKKNAKANDQKKADTATNVPAPKPADTAANDSPTQPAIVEPTKIPA